MSIRVLVTGIGAAGLGEQILKSLRLSKADYSIVGTDVSEESTGVRMVDTFEVVPFVSDETYKTRIFEIIDKYEIQFVFPGSEAELVFMSDNRDELEKRGIHHPLNSAKLLEVCLNKFKNYEFLRKLDIPIPGYWPIARLEDIENIGAYPVVLKPNTGSGGSSNVYIAFDQEDARAFSKYMLRQGIDVIAQEYIGGKDDEYTIGVSADKDGNILGSIVIQRIMNNALTTRFKIKHENADYYVSTGISQGRVIHHPELQKQAEHIAKSLNSTGPLNVQCRFVDGALFLLEINPRLSGTTSLRALADYNEPEMMIDYYINNKAWVNNYKEMTILRTIDELVASEV